MACDIVSLTFSKSVGEATTISVLPSPFTVIVALGASV